MSDADRAAMLRDVVECCHAATAGLVAETAAYKGSYELGKGEEAAVKQGAIQAVLRALGSSRRAPAWTCRCAECSTPTRMWRSWL